jgi:serine phosphatase RsbU (regulator of sigma subunit)
LAINNKNILFDFEDDKSTSEDELLFESGDKDEIIFAFQDGEESLENELPPWKILIVDDEEEVHKITRIVLDDFTFEGRDMSFINAYSEAEAKELLNEHSDIAVVLLDVVMENENSGLEVVKYIREVLQNKLVQIILRTGQPGQAPEKDVIKDYDINDYKEKTELTSKKLYTTIMTSLRSYQNLKKLEETSAAKEKIESELQVASKIQASMLPRIFPPFPDRNEFEIFASMEPARNVGGDFYDFFFINDDKFCFVIGDVAGNGVPAALFMVITKTLIKNEALRNISAEEILYNVNNALCKDNDEFIFVTAFIGILDLKTGELEYANAGHNAPLICQADNGECGYIKSNDTFILGITEEFEYQKGSLNLNPDDVVFLYTDGVIESRNENKEQYGSNRLQKVISEIEDKNVYNIEEVVKEDLDRFTQGSYLFDDVTMLVLKFNRTR